MQSAEDPSKEPEAMSDERWYWCLRHGRVERPGECRSDDRLGPYPTPDDARQWRHRHETRQERWEAEDERWERWGEDEDEDEDEDD
jgi:hypothetical protein